MWLPHSGCNGTPTQGKTPMEALNAEALWYAGQWWFRDDVSHTPELAERLVRARRRLPRWPLAVPAQKTGL